MKGGNKKIIMEKKFKKFRGSLMGETLKAVKGKEYKENYGKMKDFDDMPKEGTRRGLHKKIHKSSCGRKY